MKKLFIGQLAFSTTESQLRELFSQFEPLASVKIIGDKFTGQSRGFGFIEIEDTVKASEAIEALNGKILDGRTIEVNEARPPSGGARSSGGYRQRFGDSNGSKSYDSRRF